MNIQEASSLYEKWLAEHVELIQPDLTRKHQQMALAVFPFLRATYYRWAQTWQAFCPDLADAPEVLSVGDLHVENFGTWRDSEGRLIWGINDFDEAFPLPWPADLVRLATSTHIAGEAAHLAVARAEACDAILEGYQQSIRDGGKPFVLAEEHKWLRKIALDKLRDPVQFWGKLDALTAGEGPVQPSAATTLAESLPEAGLEHRIVHRVAGLGSLGRPRWVALANWRGGKIAREAKAIAPSACAWASNRPAPYEIYYDAIVNAAVRVPDPIFKVRQPWIVRRLAPDCSRIELADLPEDRDEYRLLFSMGYETGNIHLGTPGARDDIQRDMVHRPKKWLHESAKRMGNLVSSDWDDWRKVKS
jgi:hypothetical protein